MSYNPVWSEFEKIMSDKGFFKTAKERDKDYDVIPDSGEGLLAEESGYDLIENIAHPEQVQVAESTLNDGIVENGVEQQKMMIDVALRQPRGVLADLIKKLVSLANQHDAELTHDGFKLAQEIDELVVKIAQQQQPLTSVAPVGDGSVTDWGSGVFTGVGMGAAMLAGGPLGWVVGGTLFLNEAIDYAHKKVGDLYEGFRKAAQYLRKLDFGGYLTTLSGQTQAQKELETRIADIANVLDGYGQLEIVYNNDPNSLILSTYQAIQFINNTSSFVTSALKQTTDLSGDPRKAEVVWNRMANFAQKWLNVTRERVLQLKQQNNVQQPNMSMDPSKLMSVPPMAAQPQQEVGVNSKCHQ